MVYVKAQVQVIIPGTIGSLEHSLHRDLHSSKHTNFSIIQSMLKKQTSIP